MTPTGSRMVCITAWLFHPWPGRCFCRATRRQVAAQFSPEEKHDCVATSRRLGTKCACGSVRLARATRHVSGQDVVFVSYLAKAESFVCRDDLSRQFSLACTWCAWRPCLTWAPRPILVHGWIAPFLSLEVRALALTIGTWPGAWPGVDRHNGADLTASAVYDIAVPVPCPGTAARHCGHVIVHPPGW